MLVRCPSCGHSRHINPDKIPPRAEFATCPKCAHRFRFRALDPAPASGAAEAAPALAKPEEHKDIWDAVDSLHERWKGGRDGEGGEERPRKDPRRPAEDAAEEDIAGDKTRETFIPWEKPRELGFPASFYRTFLMVLLHPGRFFASLTGQPPIAQALLFYIVFGLLQTACNMFWWHVAINSSIGPTLAGRIGPVMLQALDISQLPFMLLTSPLILSLYLFIMAGIIHLMMRLVDPGKASFAKTFKVAGYASAGMLFSVVPFLGFLMAPLCFLALLLTGCRHAFRLSWSRAFLVLIPPYIMFLLLSAGQVGVTA
jgi:predicted Zn finger-like uncharacterized protein